MKTANHYLWPSLVALLFLNACDSRHAFDFWHDRDYLLKDGEFSVTVSKETGVQVSGWMEHGSGYTAKCRNDYWRVIWKTNDLTKDASNTPSKVVYVGKYEARREAGKSMPIFESGIDMEMSDFTGKDHFLAWQNGQDLSPKLPVSDKIEFEGKRQNDGKHTRVLTPSRQHMLVWGKPFQICQTSDLKTVREIDESEAVAKLRKLHDRAIGIHHIVLTDDLRYLIVVPHNGNDSQFGHNHHRVWCCDLSQDRFFEQSFSSGAGDTAVASVQSWQGHLYFFVYSDQRDLSLVDEHVRLIAKIPSEKTRIHNFEANFFWQPDQHTVWIAEGNSTSSQRERRIELRKFNYLENSSIDFVLGVDSLKVP